MAQSAQGAIFEKGVSIDSTPEVALDSHQVLNDFLPRLTSAGVSTAISSRGCGCRACSALEVTTGDDGGRASAASAPLTLSGGTILDAGVDLSKVFQLHSNPTATKTIFLDFDGHTVNNTPWENGGNLSLRSFYSTFDSTAHTEIQRIWQRVAEDFAPFNVNVTTQDPGSENLRKFGSGDDRWGIRVAFTRNHNLLTGTTIKNAGGGGTAYYNSFNWSTDDVALVFNRGEYTAAETASHEVGHALNLRHDGAGSTTYYAGHGGTGPTSWGTIMGSPWTGNDENLTQWSKGEYTNANNTWQDDLAVITTGNGFGYRADDHGNTFATATALSGLSFSSFGIIERNTDIDMFRFDSAGGLVTFDIVNASRAYIGSPGDTITEYLTSRGPNLDIGATLYRPDQSIVQTFNPADLTTASFSINLDAGTYYLGIEGVGFGNPFASTPTGYTDYGSLGQYMLSGTVSATSDTPPPPEEPPPPPPEEPLPPPPQEPPLPTTNTTTSTTTSTTLQVLDPNGAVQLLRDTATDRVSVQVNGVNSRVIYKDSQLKASQFADRKILAAETINGKNQILWQVVSTGQIFTWSLNNRWKFVSSDSLTDPISSAGLLLQQQFEVNLAGAPLNAATEAVDPIIGGGTSLAYDQSILEAGLPEGLSFSTEPILALAELTSLGATNPASIDPPVSPFPFAGLDTSITRPCCDTVA